MLQLKDDADFSANLRERVVQVARFAAVQGANAGRAPKQWAGQTDFPYLAAFDEEEVSEFSRELLAHTLDAAQRGTLENLEGNLGAWESSGAIYTQPEVLAQMTADFDLSGVIEVFPPTEEAVETASG